MAPEKKLNITALNKKLEEALTVYVDNNGHGGEIIRGVQLEVIKDLLDKGVDIDLSVHPYSHNKKFHTNLLGCFLQFPDHVQFLIDKGADVNLISDYYGKSPLQNAVGDGITATARLLVDAGADVNNSFEGETVLMAALRYAMRPEAEWPGIVPLLVEKGANIEATDSSWIQSKAGILHELLAVSEENRAILERVDVISRFLQKG